MPIICKRFHTCIGLPKPGGLKIFLNIIDIIIMSAIPLSLSSEQSYCCNMLLQGDAQEESFASLALSLVAYLGIQIIFQISYLFIPCNNINYPTVTGFCVPCFRHKLRAHQVAFAVSNKIGKPSPCC